MVRQLLVVLILIAGSIPALAQEKGTVFIPSEMELTEEQRAELQKSVVTEVQDALKKCVAAYPRPEFFTSVVVDYTLKKSGKLSGGYVGGASPDPGLYVKDEEERAKLETEGALARLVARNDRNLERCMKKATGGTDTGLQRYSVAVTASFDIAWKGTSPTLTPSQFEVVKKD